MAAHYKLSTSKEISEREKKNGQLAYEIATEGIVLLANDGTLPIAPQHVALFGAGAAKDFKGGTGSGEVNERHTVSIIEGLEQAGFSYSTEAWIEAYKTEMKEEKANYQASHKHSVNPFAMVAEDMINIMSDPFRYPFGPKLSEKDLKDSKSETCIYIISRQAGECYDRRMDRCDFNLSEREIENLKIARAYYKKLILVINIGGLIDLSPIDAIGVNAVLQFGQQGQEAGRALADILSGKAVPSGHLTDTWMKSYDQIPYGENFSYMNGDSLHEEYCEGIYVGYRYFDSFDIQPRYEFGYGLSYTDFSVTGKGLAMNGSKVTVTAEVANTGDTYPGKETLQIYVSCPSGKISREAQSLIAYGKTDLLMPGASQSLSLTFDMKDLAAYQEETASYLLEPGAYIIRVGNSSRKTSVLGVIEVESEIVVSKCTNIAPNPRKNSMAALQQEGPQRLREIPADTLHLTMEADAIETIVYNYQKPARKSTPQIDQLLNKMTLKEKIHMVTGTGILDMAGGNKFIDAPGAAAFTTSELVKKGLTNVILADGPAGLRLNKTCGMNKKGKVKAADAMMELMENQGGLMSKLMYADLTKDTPLYQFATAFPVGTSVAQTWNQPLIEKMGDAVGTEMEEYGITFWLAPGMNIHRNPLCGRNYEYYSEDPVISGKTAAAIARGVQKHEGCYVTIKHYCCNNQETDRSKTSAYINERPLREIYLKGFEIAVRESDPKSVMTSYNLVNDRYPAASGDFCMKALRNEWGFSGVVMTDWFASWPGQADTVDGLKGGNDLHMPGGSKNWKPIKAALKNKTLTMEELEWNCANALDLILKSKVQKEFFGTK